VFSAQRALAQFPPTGVGSLTDFPIYRRACFSLFDFQFFDQPGKVGTLNVQNLRGFGPVTAL
ncbi:uncharacterized protein METZ01_LOCUS286200, partial [marine metagenome]